MAKQEADQVSNTFLGDIWNTHKERPKRAQMLEVSLLGGGTELRIERDAWSMWFHD